MHEMSIAQNIVEIVEEILQNESGSSVSKVCVKIGELIAVVPESLQFCYSAITAGTTLEKSKLVIEEIPVKVRCKKCESLFRVQSFVFQCPECNGTELETISGRELSVSEIEVDEWV
jgi:hydrogenase nickel incorporation protein HypA/HybF